MIVIDKTPVEISSELHPIIWRGRQWAVTEYGIESLDGHYYIEPERLEERIHDGTLDWPQHMAEKSWVDVDDFCTAFMVALAVFRDKHSVSGEDVLEGLRAALRVRSSRAEEL